MSDLRNILILGSKGFIGSHCLAHFVNLLGWQAWGGDVVSDYASPNYFLIDPSNSDFHALFEAVEFDVCINCSGAASVPDSIVHPKRDFYLNTLNVFNLLDAIREHRPGCCFVNLSSAAVYGSPEKLPIRETQDIRPVSPYGYHKRIAEELCREFHEIYGLATCSVRIFSSYGPGLKKQLFWDIYRKSQGSSEIRLFGTGQESRDFIYISDVVRALALLVEAPSYFDGRSLNLATGREHCVKDVAEILLGHLGWTGNLTFSGEHRKGDPVHWRADTSRFDALGFSPMVAIEEGLREYAKWLDTQ